MTLRLLLTTLFLFHGVSFSMIPHYKNKENKEILESSARKYAIRIAAQFAQEEEKRWSTLPKEEQDFCKLEKLYRNQSNPKFVANFLRKYDLPVLVVNLGDSRTKLFATISPYEKKFYRDPHKQLFGRDIVLRGCCKQLDAVKNNIGEYEGDISTSLSSSVLFGKNEDVLKELRVLDKLPQDIKHLGIYASILVALNYHDKKNSMLELLLSHEQQHTKNWINNMRFIFSSSLLTITAPHKELFELISNKDPYNFNREIYTLPPLRRLQTHLELIRENKDIFNQEHIDIFMRDGGGMTVAEVEAMEQVDRIVNKKPLTHEEEQQRRFWERIIRNMSREEYNEYLEYVRGGRNNPELQSGAREFANTIQNIRERVNMVRAMLLQNQQRRNI